MFIVKSTNLLLRAFFFVFRVMLIVTKIDVCLIVINPEKIQLKRTEKYLQKYLYRDTHTNIKRKKKERKEEK